MWGNNDVKHNFEYYGLFMLNHHVTFDYTFINRYLLTINLTKPCFGH